MCYCLDDDFSRTLYINKADVATGTIKTAAANGFGLDDGTVPGADIIVTATGFSTRFAGGIRIPNSVDGEAVM